MHSSHDFGFWTEATGVYNLWLWRGTDAVRGVTQPLPGASWEERRLCKAISQERRQPGADRQTKTC